MRLVEEISQKFRDWIDNRHEYAKEWKEKSDHKVVGYFCTYVPEEILYAANMLPVRILGSHEPPTVTEPYIFAMFCHLCRDCLEWPPESQSDARTVGPDRPRPPDKWPR